MRGNKFCILSIVMTLLVAVSVGIVAFFPKENLKIVHAEDTSIYKTDNYSQKYNDNIIFSAEQVYFNDDETIPLKYSKNGSNFNEIYSAKGASYFADYSYMPNGKKKVIYDGDYAIIDDTAYGTYTAFKDDNIELSVQQGVMLTLGGYVYTPKTSTEEEKYSFNGKGSGANILTLRVDVKRNGTTLTDVSGVRTYNSKYNDWVWFVQANEETEGYYELTITYQLEGGDTQVHSFNFFLLLKSSYQGTQKVNENTYNQYPTLSNVESNNYFYLENMTQDSSYPILTYDYKSFDFSYSLITNDDKEEISFEYDETNNRLIKTINFNGFERKEYISLSGYSNSIVNVVFTKIGRYNLKFNYVYYYNNARLAVQSEVIPDMALNISGYTMKYAKNGFGEADMRYIEVSNKDTVCVVNNGYQEKDLNNLKSLGVEELGIHYEFDNTLLNKKSGYITKNITTDITKQISDNSGNIVVDAIENIVCNNTDQGGVWFSLNDKYDIANSKYYKSKTPFKKVPTDESVDFTSVDFTKETVFTDTGYYYFVVLQYKLNQNDNSRTQCFYFRLSSSVNNVSLFGTTEDELTDEEIDKSTEKINSYGFTNKNVWAKWDLPNVFEASQTVTVYHTVKDRNGSPVYRTETEMLNFAKGIANYSDISKYPNFEQKKTLLKESGSYLVVVQVDNTSTQNSYYFTIDKEDISGLNVYQVDTIFSGTSSSYYVKKDKNGSYVSLTKYVYLDNDFTLDWDLKNSGAFISAYCNFTPIYKNGAKNYEYSKFTLNGVDYELMINNYTFGSTTNNIALSKSNISTEINANNVFTRQGVYWFTLQDEAGNFLNYMIVLDKTESNFLAYAYEQLTSEPEDWSTDYSTYYVFDSSLDNYVLNSSSNFDENTKYFKRIEVQSNDTVSCDVEIIWGSHKALGINNNGLKGFLDKIKTADEITGYSSDKQIHYYTKNSSNMSALNRAVVNYGGEKYYTVKNNKISKKDMAGNIEEIKDKTSILIKLKTNIEKYDLYLFGENQIEENQNSEISSRTYFGIKLNPDNADGAVYASDDYTTNWNENFNEVNASGGANADIDDNYSTARGVDSNFLYFSWVNGDGTDYEVSKVYYEYYSLISNLDALNERVIDYESKVLYPYSYSTMSYIYDADNNIRKYNSTEVQGKTKCFSLAINVGYSVINGDSGQTVKRCTQPGLYIVTREYRSGLNISSQDSQKFSYIFVVDRNGVIEYSYTDFEEKIVGKYIGMQLQEDETYSNFAIEGLEEHSLTYISKEFGNESERTLNYYNYLSTSKIPMELKVPVGKYVSKNGENFFTSQNFSGRLKYRLFYVDNYNILGKGENASYLLYTHSVSKIDYDGYIKLSFNAEYIDNYDYLSAMGIQAGGWISLPGSYVVQILDNIGYEEQGAIQSAHELIFGIKVANNKPTADVVIKASKNSLEEHPIDNGQIEVSTNKELIDVKIDNTSVEEYQAKKDINYILITRYETESDYNKNIGSKYFERKDNKITQTGVITSREDTFEINADGNYSIAHLPTDVVVNENGKIISYQEYVYAVEIRYELKNANYLKAYQYKTNGETKEFYSQTYIIKLDREGNTSTLANVKENQTSYFEKYLDTLTKDENGYANKNKYNTNLYDLLGYRYVRDNDLYEDNYAVVNPAFYYFVESGNVQKAKSSVYAFRIDDKLKQSLEDCISKENILPSNVFYRKLKLNDTMGLLPVCESYWTSGSFVKFTRNSANYETLNVTSNGNTSNIRFEFDSNSYYELVIIDDCGNYTQFVVLYQTSDYPVELKLSPLLTNESSKEISLSFDSTFNHSSSTIFGLNSLELKNIGEDGSDNFFRFDLTSSTGESKVLYTNLSTTNQDIASAISEFMEEENNYTITLTDRYNRKYTLYINNIKENHSLNVSNLTVMGDAVNRYYIIPNRVNFYIDNGNILYYASQITIQKSGDTYSTTYLMGPDGNLYLNGENIGDKIFLDNESIYSVEIVDICGNVYTKRLSTKQGAIDYEYNIVSGHEYTYNDTIYTDTDVLVRFDADVYAKVEINYNGTEYVISNGVLTEKGKTNIVDLTSLSNILEIDSTGKILNLNLLAGKLDASCAQTGELRKFRIAFYYNDKEEAHYNFVIDNRLPNVLLQDTTLVDYSNIISVSYDENNLDYVKAISKTISISWGNFEDFGSDNYYSYKVFLREYKTSTNYEETEYTNLVSRRITITPKDNVSGKYALVFRTYIKDEDNGHLINSKFFVFCVTSTDNSIYEIRYSEGSKESVNPVDITTLLEIGEARYGKDQFDNNKDLNFTNNTLYNQLLVKYGLKTSMPLYIVNRGVAIIPNSDKGVEVDTYEYTLVDNGNSGYAKIILYRIYIKEFYETYACVLEVKTKNDFVSTFQIVYDEVNENNETIQKISDLKTSDSLSLSNLASSYVLQYSAINTARDNISNASSLEKKNKIILSITYEDHNAVVADFTTSEGVNSINLEESGIYYITIKDTAGNVHKFINNEVFTLTVLNEVTVSVNDNAYIPNAFYSSDVVIKVLHTALIENIKVEITLNGEDYSKSLTADDKQNRVYKFTEYGTYVITISGKIYNTNKDLHTRKIIFTIVNPDEARLAIDFTSVKKFSIDKAYNITDGLQVDVTRQILELLNEDYIYSKLLTYERLQEKFGATIGKQKYLIQYSVNDNILPVRNAEFMFTLNNEIPSLTCSEKSGAKTTKKITIELNPYIIYKQVGDCKIVINNQTAFEINASTAENTTKTITLSDVNTYYVKLMTDSGRVINSFKVTIKEPLNTISIILIVVGSLIVIAVVVVFIIMRTRMKVK